jgi:hypothetical protein
MKLNGQHLIRLPIEDSKSNYTEGFWQWVSMLADGDYERAVEAIVWPKGSSMTADALKKCVTSFFGGDKPWSVVIPNDRLVNVINERIECEFGIPEGGGWFMGQIPVTTALTDPKDDGILLAGLATSFFVRQYQGCYVLDFEIFHF